MLAGVLVAERVWRIVERPPRDHVVGFVALAGVGAPMITGVIDLLLRFRTP